MSIYEKDSLEMVYEFLDAETLLVLDLDNTLIESVYHYGSYQWGTFLTKRAIREGLSVEKALDKVMPVWEKAQYEIEMKLIEEGLNSFMINNASVGVTQLALTGRSPQIAKITLQQLERFQVEFSVWDPLKFSFELPYEYLFKNGVFFAGTKNEKGAILYQLLNQMPSKFKRVVFVDDQMYLVQQVGEALKELPIEYHGIRYSGADKRVLGFNYSIAEKEKQQLLTN